MRRSSDADAALLSSLSLLFENPLESVEAIIVKSNSEAVHEIDSLSAKLQPHVEWDDKLEAIKRSMGLIKGGALSFPDFDLTMIAPAVAETVTDLRSALVKWGALFASAAAQALGSKFSTLSDIFVPSLFKQATHGTAVISQSCRFGILQIAEFAQNRKTYRSIISEISSKSNARRLIVAESLRIIVSKWPSNILQPILNDVNTSMTKLKSDAAVEVRNVFRTTSSSIPRPPTRSISPGRMMTPQKPITPIKDTTGSPKFVPPLSSPLIKTLPPPKILNFVTPKTQSEAISYGKNIHTLFETNNSVSIKKLGKNINESLPIAIELSPKDEIWKTLLPVLFDRFNEELIDTLGRILVAMNYDEVVLPIIIEKYGLYRIMSKLTSDGIIELYMHIKNANPSIHIDEDCINIIRSIDPSLFSQLSLGTSKQSEKALSSIIDNIFSSINKEEDYMQIIYSLSSYSESDIDTIINEKIGVIIEYLDSENTNIVIGIMSFCEYIITNYNSIDMNFLFDNLVKLLLKENSVFPPYSERLLTVLFPTIDIKKHIIPYLQTESIEAASLISVISNYLEIAPDIEVLRFSESLSDILISLSECSNISIRRSVIMCFVHFSNELKESFDDVIKRLNQTNQQLVKRYLAKRAN